MLGLQKRNGVIEYESFKNFCTCCLYTHDHINMKTDKNRTQSLDQKQCEDKHMKLEAAEKIQKCAMIFFAALYILVNAV